MSDVYVFSDDSGTPFFSTNPALQGQIITTLKRLRAALNTAHGTGLRKNVVMVKDASGAWIDITNSPDDTDISGYVVDNQMHIISQKLEVTLSPEEQAAADALRYVRVKIPHLGESMDVEVSSGEDKVDKIRKNVDLVGLVPELKRELWMYQHAYLKLGTKRLSESKTLNSYGVTNSSTLLVEMELNLVLIVTGIGFFMCCFMFMVLLMSGGKRRRRRAVTQVIVVRPDNLPRHLKK